MLLERVADDKSEIEPQILAGAQQAAQEGRENCDEDELLPLPRFRLGNDQWKLSTLCWVMGEGWDFLDI